MRPERTFDLTDKRTVALIKSAALALLWFYTLYINATTYGAFALGRTVPPSEWWGEPNWSPNGNFIAVQSPPAEKVPFKGKDGKTYISYTNPDRKTLILGANDYSLAATIEQSLWPTWSPNGKLLAALTSDKGDFHDFVAVYDSASGSRVRKFNVDGFTSTFAWSPDSQKLLILQRKSVSVCDLTKKEDTKLPSDDDECYWRLPAWSPDGESIAASASLPYRAKPSSVIKIWDARSGICNRSIKLSSGTCSISWSPDGTQFLYSEPGAVKVLDSKTGGAIRTVKTDECVSFLWSPKQTSLAYRDRDLVHILDALTMSETKTLQGPKNGNFNFDWSPDEKYIVLDGRELVAVCDTSSGQCLGFNSWPDLSRAHWTPDGKFLSLSMLNSSPKFVSVRLPRQGISSIFEGGNIGAPGWAHYPSPRNLQECFEEFDRSLPSNQRERFKNTMEDRLGDFGGGSMITDSLISDVYYKWGRFDLDNFFEQHGLTDPRDMLDIVVVSYWRHLHAKPLNFDEQVQKHKDWWQSQAQVVEENRPLSTGLLNFTVSDKRIGDFSIGSLKARLKIVSFVDTDGILSAAQLKSFQTLRDKYPSKELVFVVFVVPAENLTNKRWPPIKLIVVRQNGETPWKDIAEFQRNSADGILVSPASYELCKEFLQFESTNVSRFTSLDPPQTLVVTSDGLVKLRVNRFDNECTEKILENQIKEALVQE